VRSAEIVRQVQLTCVGGGYSNWFTLTCCAFKADYCFILNREDINRI